MKMFPNRIKMNEENSQNAKLLCITFTITIYRPPQSLLKMAMMTVLKAA